MSDLSFNVIALDRASKTFLSAAESIDRMVAKLDKLDGKTATATVNIKTDESQKALDSFTNRFALMTAGIAAASPIAGAAIVGGIGAGFIGLTVLAQKSNEQVQQTYKTLWSNVVSQTQAATSQLVPQLVASGNQIGHTFESLEPQMRRAFSAAGPDLQALTNGVTQFATNAMPGVTSAMTNSLPIFEGIEHAASDLGTSFGTSVASIGQNSSAYGATIQSFGQITGTVLGLAVTLVNDLAQVWAASGQDITAAISGVAQVAAGLAGGALPILTAGLTAAAQILTVVANVLDPLSPLLGTVGVAALATWAAFKLASAVSVGVKALATSVLDLGVKMETGTARAAAAGIAIQGVGARAATTAVGTAAMAESLAGPVGIALAVATVGFGLLSGVMSNSSTSAEDLAGSMGGVTAALQASNGEINTSVVNSIQSGEEFKKAADAAKQFGISQSALVPAITGQGNAYENLVKQLQGVVDANHEVESSESGDTRISSDKLNATGTQAQMLIDRLKTLSGDFKDSAASANQQNVALQNNASTLTRSAAGMAAASNFAQSFGTNVYDGVEALRAMALASGDSAATVDQLTRAMGRAQLSTANAGAAITTAFSQADAQVTQARQSVAQAAHGVEQASRSVADAQHGEATAARGLAEAQRGVVDAQRGVVTAQRAVTDAQRQERDAQVSLNEARQQAVRDLKAMHQQLDDQFTSEASARVRLFDAQAAGLNAGVDSSNARQIASGPVTAENEDKVKAAIDLLSAQNALNSATQNGVYLKQDVAAADARGVEGSKGVVSAQQQVASAQQQVQDASYGVEQAQRAVQRAQQGVADAAYAQQRAHQAVRDAQYQQKQASDQLTTANQVLAGAVDATSRSFDWNTDAGRRNIGLLQTLSDAIIKEYGPTAAGYNKLIQETADKFGITTGAAQDLLGKLGEIPKDFKFGMTAVAGVDTAALSAVFKGTSAGGYFNDSMNQRKTIGGTGLASGGQVFGPGGPKDDLVNARLSPGEFVHQAEAVDYYGVGFMKALNERRVPKFADGGLMDVIQANAFGAGAGSSYATNINAFETMGFKHPAQLPKYVPPAYGEYTGGGIPNYKPGSGVARWSGEAMAAMGELSIPASFLPAVLRRMAQESGGNPTIVNDWDSNWQKGTPSVGLMQVIGPTFRANAGPHVGTSPFIYGVSVDPVSNIYAGLNYAGRRYSAGHGGYLGGVLYAMNKPGGYAAGGLVMPRPRAYDNGGALPPGMSTVWNGTGKPENVRTSSQEDAIVQSLRDLRAAVDRAFTRPMEGTLRTERGALLGEFEAAFRQLEHEGGMR
ncbi:transglycosylase SLT domain-containing protein [Amycolatopsis sp. NPDC088138]|uniref:transglycosylase SLT domain-containing protein n=1 Tax=Amycolatopsis sp. NPDC088138 TaxID=3363938 RepID=UPI00382BB853